MTRTVVFIIRLHQVMNIDPEMTNLAQLAHPLSREEEPGHIPKVLTHSPECLVSVDVGLIPLQKLLGRCDILGNRLLGQNMLACEKSLLDEFWLDQNWETGEWSA